MEEGFDGGICGASEKGDAMITIEDFCSRHRACPDGREWALANCRTMQDAWDTARPEWLVWIATRPGVLDDRTLRRFAVWSVRQVQHLMEDPRSVAALDLAERHADGKATDEELAAAWTDAWNAACRAARCCASRVAAGAARAAAEAAARSSGAAALVAAEAAAWDAAWVAAEAAWDAAGAEEVARDAFGAARAEQAAWLRENAKPNFDFPA